MHIRASSGRSARLVAGILAAGLVAVGCGTADDDPVATPAPATEPAPTAGSPRVTGEPSPAAPAMVVDVVVRGGEVVEGPSEAEISLGEQVRLRVTADRADEVHVHGYDLTRELAPGDPATVSFTADIPGQFEVELEQSQLHLLDLVVR